MTFLGSSDQFSLGSKWFWYLQNDKMCTLGPTESTNGVRKGPRRAWHGPQNPTAPLRAYFSLFWGGQAQNFSKSFWAKNGQKFFSKKNLFALFRLPKGLGPSKTQNWPCRPPQWSPFWPNLWAKRPILGSKIAFFSNMYFRTKWLFWGPRISFHWVLSGFGTSKTIKCTH